MARVVTPTYMAHCPTCGHSTHHSGLTDEVGREIGSFCIDCAARRDELEHAAFVEFMERRGFLTVQPDLLTAIKE